ncbi:unnamed protein product [Phytomonas sp. EM1]|nr:unnamed protein product [Phytomonas sp. EM1]|eukprot:CCW65734.1 unnamed protein product [Phytomonas sp. isolate EM1]
MDRLKKTLEEMADEFSERTCTYVRQQGETEQFFRLREENMKHAFETARTDVESLTRRVEQLCQVMRNAEAMIEECMGVSHNAFLDYMLEKERLYASAFSRVHEELLSQYASSREEVSSLLEDVMLLSPLSEKVICQRNDIAKLIKHLNASKEENEQLRKDLSRLRCVCALSMTRIKCLCDRDRRVVFFQRWVHIASCNRRRRLQEDHARLAAALTEQLQEFNLQKQNTVSQHHKKVEQLQAELIASQLQQRQLLDELGLLNKKCEESDLKRREVEMELSAVAVQRLHEKQEGQSLLYELGTARVDCMLLAESRRRFSIEKSESISRSEIYQQDACTWKSQLDFQRDQMMQITTTYKTLRQHHEAQAAARREQDKVHYVMLSRFIRDFCVRRLASRAFGLWRSYTLCRSVQHCEVAHRTAQQDELDAFAEQTMSQIQQLQDESRTEMMQLHTEHLQCLEHTKAIQDEMASLEEDYSAELALVNAEHLEVKQAYAALRGEHEVYRKQMEGASELLVEYCAAATFARWKAWACELRSQRLRRQYEGLFLAISQWRGSLLHEVQFFSQRREEILSDSVASVFVVFSLHGRNSYHELSERFDSLNSCNDDMKAQIQKLKWEREQLGEQLSSKEEHYGKLRKELVEMSEAYERCVTEQSSLNRFLTYGHHLMEVHLEEVAMTFLTVSSAHFSALLKDQGVSPTSPRNNHIEAEGKVVGAPAPRLDLRLENVQEFTEPTTVMRVHAANPSLNNSENFLQVDLKDGADSSPCGVAPQLALTEDAEESAKSFARAPDILRVWAHGSAEAMNPLCVGKMQEVPGSVVKTEEICTKIHQNLANAIEGQTAILLEETLIDNNKTEFTPDAASLIHGERFDVIECHKGSEDVDQSCKVSPQTHCELSRMSESSFQEPIAVLQNAVVSLISLLSRFEGFSTNIFFSPDSRPTDLSATLRHFDDIQHSMYADTDASYPGKGVFQKGSLDDKGGYLSANRVPTEKVESMDSIHLTKGLLGHTKFKLSDTIESTINKASYAEQTEPQGGTRVSPVAAVSRLHINQGQIQEKMDKQLLCAQNATNPPTVHHLKNEITDLHKGVNRNRWTHNIEEETLKCHLEAATTQIIEAGKQMQRIFYANINTLRSQTQFLQSEIQRIRQAGAEEAKREFDTLREALEMRFQIQLMSLQGRIKQLELEKEYLESRETQIGVGSADLLREVRRDLANLSVQYQDSIEALKMCYGSQHEDHKGEVSLSSILVEYDVQACVRCFLLSHTYIEAYSAKADWLVESFLMVSGEGSRGRSSGLGVLHSADSDTQLKLLLCRVQTHWMVCAGLREESLKDKCRLFTDGIISLMQRCWEKCSLLLGQTRQASLVDMEAIETENMQLHEKLAYLEAQVQVLSRWSTADDVLIHSDEAHVQGKEARYSIELPNSRASAERIMQPPTQDASMDRVAPSFSTYYEENCSPDQPHTHGTTRLGERSLPVRNKPSSEDTEVPPMQGSVTNSYRSGTPINSSPHVKDISLDSLELSLGILRYSDMLSEQTLQNEERLDYVDLLSAELEDLAMQGHRIWNHAKRESFTPMRRKHGGRITRL